MAFLKFNNMPDAGVLPVRNNVIAAILGYTPANKAGDTFTGAVTMNSTLAVTGAITCSADVAAFSDERLKTNWRSLKGGFLDNLAHVKYGVFDRIDRRMTQVGLSAQDVQKFVPEAIHTSLEGFHSIAYGQLAAVAAVELAKEVMALRKELSFLHTILKAKGIEE